MNFPAFLYSGRPQTQRRRLRANSADLYLYQAITGRSAEIAAPQASTKNAPTIAANGDSRHWKPSVAELTLKIRSFWEQKIARKPEIADWIRHVSGEAFKRIDQAHIRLHASRPDPSRRRVESREVMSVQPVDEAEPMRFYKRVA